MQKHVVNFMINKINANSIRALVSAIETHPVLKKIKINFVSEANNVLSDENTIAAFSFMSTRREQVAKEVKQLRNANVINGNIVVVAGEPHPSGAPEDTIKIGFDYCFVGESKDIF